MGVALIVIQLSRRVSELGFNQALVQLKKIKTEHYDTIFVVNSVLGLLIITGILLSAPYLAIFFNDNRLTLIFKVISLEVLLGTFANIPRTVLVRKMKFKELGLADALGSAVLLISPILFALLGFGVWSLVFGNILGSVTMLVFLFRFSKWYPTFNFRIWALKEVYAFGLWTTAGKYLTYCIDNCDKFLIAKFLGVTQLGFYERAGNLLSIPRVQITYNLNRVLFSAYSKIQDDDKRTVNSLYKILNYLALLLYPSMIGMYFLAPSFVTVLYGPKWRPATGPLQLLCFSIVTYSLARALFPVVMARGWVRHGALIQSIYLLVLVGGLILGLKGGINGVALSVSLLSTLLLLFLLVFLRKKIQFTIRKFVLTQKSALIYGSVQIIFLVLLQNVSQKFYPVDSWPMLILVSVVSLLSLVVAHGVFRCKDVDEVIQAAMLKIRKKRRAEKVLVK